MADSILRLKVESQEYDAKIKRASEGLQRYVDGCRQAGGTLESLDDGVLDFVKALGDMGTVATTSKAKLREMSAAITDLTVTYRGLTEEEKKGDVGKSLSASLEKLKVRAATVRDAIKDVDQELNNLASDTSFSDGMSMMAHSVGSVGTAIVALTGDSKEMKAVLMDIAKIQSTVQAVDSLTKAFQKQNLVLLKNPYVLAATAVSALGVAIYECAKKADDGTKDINDYRLSIEKLGSAAEIAKYSLSDLLNIRINEQKINSAVDKINELEQKRAKLQNKLDNWDADKAKTKEYWGDLGLWFQDLVGNATESSPQLLQAGINKLTREMEFQQNLVKKYTGENTLINNSYENKTPSSTSTPRGGHSSGGNTPPIARVLEITPEEMNLPEFASATYGATESMKSLRKALAYYQQMVENATDSRTYMEGLTGVEYTKRAISAQPLALKSGISIDMAVAEQQIQEMRDNIQASLDQNALQLKVELENGAGAELAKDGKSTAKEWQAAASAISAVGSAMGQIEDPAAKVAGTIAQAIASIALGFATASTTAASAGPIAWIAAVASGLATMTATIAAVKSATKGYAEGGVIPGNSFSGDNQLARVNAGETILTRAQAGLIANALEGNNFGNLELSSRVRGTDLILTINNSQTTRNKGKLKFQ